MILFFLILLLICILLDRKVSPGIYDYEDATFPWSTSPSSYLSPMNSTFGTYNVLLDGHAHTTESDGKLKPGQVVEWARAHGYNAIVVSDHNDASGGLKAQAYAKERYNDFVVIPGQEYSCCRIHMNFLNLNTTIKPTSPWPSDAELKRVVDQVHSLGGLVVVNHVAWSNHTTAPFQEATLPDHPSREALLALGVDGIEVVNGNTFDMRSWSLQQQHPNSLFSITGSDLHTPDGAYAWTILNAPNLTVEGILGELRAHRSSFLLDAGGTRPRVYPDFTGAWKAFSPLSALSDLASLFYSEEKGMYSFQGSFCQPKQVEVHGGIIGYALLYFALLVGLYEVSRLFFLWAFQLALARLKGAFPSRAG